MTYVEEDLTKETTITHSHFVFLNQHTGTQSFECENERDNPQYIIKIATSKDDLLQIWKRGQNMLESSWRS